MEPSGLPPTHLDERGRLKVKYNYYYSLYTTYVHTSPSPVYYRCTFTRTSLSSSLTDFFRFFPSSFVIVLSRILFALCPATQYLTTFRIWVPSRIPQQADPGTPSSQYSKLQYNIRHKQAHGLSSQTFGQSYRIRVSCTSCLILIFDSNSHDAMYRIFSGLSVHIHLHVLRLALHMLSAGESGVRSSLSRGHSVRSR